MSKDSGYQFYDKKLKFRKGDLILIPFGSTVPSVYQVESARGKKLLVVVIEDNYEKNPTTRGTILDISTAIYEGYWCHRHLPKTTPKSSKVYRTQV